MPDFLFATAEREILYDHGTLLYYCYLSHR